MTKRIEIFGINLDCLTMDETLNKIVQSVENKEYIQHVVINAGKVNLMQKDSKLKEIVNKCPIINADGQSIVWAGRFLGYNVPERVTGIDLFDELVSICAEKNYKPYFFGAKEHVVKKVVEHYKWKFPQLTIAGYRNGYFSKEDSYQIAKEIQESGADMLFVAFSSPLKEYWIDEYKNVMQVPFTMGVGGSFDVVAKETRRAPEWMQKNGLEWFFRFIQEPRRMFKRYIIGNILFAKIVLKEKLKL